jgi:nitrilase
MARIVRVAAVQIAPDLTSLQGTLNGVLAAIGEASERGAALAVFPETFLPWYPYFAAVHAPAAIQAEHLRLYENAVAVPGPVTEAIAYAARRHGVVVMVGVNERDGGSLYNAELIFDADGTLLLKHRKISPAYHERMIWGQGDGSTLTVVKSKVGRIGTLACWEHYNPLARYALMAQREEIHVSNYPGSLFGQTFADQTEVQLRNHALESGCFVVNATAWLSEKQIEQIVQDEEMRNVVRGGCMTAIIGPDGRHVVAPLTRGEGILFADIDLDRILARKRLMDSVGHYARPELLSLELNNPERAPVTGGSVRAAREQAVFIDALATEGERPTLPVERPHPQIAASAE